MCVFQPTSCVPCQKCPQKVNVMSTGDILCLNSYSGVLYDSSSLGRVQSAFAESVGLFDASLTTFTF